jgi:hypothetical protein
VDNWKPIASAPKDGTPVLLWVTQFGTAGQSEPSAVAGFWHKAVEQWRMVPDYLNRGENLTASYWMELPKPPGES